jgi:hypothetical protein
MHIKEEIFEMATHPLTPSDAITQFEKSTATGVWPQLQKLTLVNLLRTRVGNPYSVNQGQQVLCGPAAITFALINRDPLRYVQICQRLFELGSFGPPLTLSKTIQASNELRGHTPETNIPQIDWMLAATLREAENLFFSVTSKFGQLTLDEAMKTWATELLLDCHRTEVTSCYTFGALEALQKAQTAIGRGGVAFLLIDSVLLGTGQGLNVAIPMVGKINLHVPTHWITVAEPITISKNSSFNCFTWAQKRPVDKPQDEVLKNLYSVVTAEP